jgi:acetoin utilization protein AcuC
MRRALLVDSLHLPTYDLGPGHPFAAFRQRPLFDLLARHRLVDDAERLLPEPATEAELGAVHEPAYVALLRRLDDPGDREARRLAPVHGLGTEDNPIRPGQHAAAAAAAGGTIACVRAVVEGRAEAAFNPAGGLHHAMPGAASGFCLYNDLALGVVEARRLGLSRIAYLDFDVHHGDGVEWIFRDDPEVLTVSFHESPDRRWPFTGRVEDRGRGAGLGAAVNVPFAPGTADPSWQEAVAEVLAAVLDRFEPELLITQHGCDPHHSDPLADLSLTTASFAFAARLSRELAARHCGGRWVATGGGGYQPYSVIPRAWAMVWAEVSGRALPERVDEGWRNAWREAAGGELPATFVDPPYDEPRAAAAAATNRATLAALRRVHQL